MSSLSLIFMMSAIKKNLGLSIYLDLSIKRPIIFAMKPSGFPTIDSLQINELLLYQQENIKVSVVM